MTGYFKNIFNRAVVVYVLTFFVVWILVDHEKARARAINYMTTSADYLMQLSEAEEVDEKVLYNYIAYYKQVLKLSDRVSTPYSLLAYSYYYLGKIKKAKQYYEKSIVYNNKYFWNYYNLSLIYFEERNYTKSLNYIEKALILKPNMTIVYAIKEPLLKSILLKTKGMLAKKDSSIQQATKVLSQRLLQGYQDALKLKILNYYHLGQYDFMLNQTLEGTAPGFKDQDFFYSKAGIALYEKEDLKKAILYFQKSLEINPARKEPYDYLKKIFEETREEKAYHEIIRLMEALNLKDKKEPIHDFKLRIL